MIGTRPNELMRRNIAGTGGRSRAGLGRNGGDCEAIPPQDRKSTRLNSSHLVISHADFCFNKESHSPRRVAPLQAEQPVQVDFLGLNRRHVRPLPDQRPASALANILAPPLRFTSPAVSLPS